MALCGQHLGGKFILGYLFPCGDLCQIGHLQVESKWTEPKWNGLAWVLKPHYNHDSTSRIWATTWRVARSMHGNILLKLKLMKQHVTNTKSTAMNDMLKTTSVSSHQMQKSIQPRQHMFLIITVLHSILESQSLASTQHRTDKHHQMHKQTNQKA